MFEQSGGTYVMAHLSTVESTDIFGLVYKGVSLAASVVGIFTQPLWPTIADALARHDFNWIQQTARKTRQSLMTIAGTLTAGLTAASVLGIEHVWHVKIGTNRALIIVLAIYLFTNIWTHYHYILLEGLDRVWAVAGLVLLENSMMLAFGTIFVPRWGAIGMAGAYLVASIVVPAWLLPCILGGRLTELKEAQRRMHMAKNSGYSSKGSEVMTNHA
jgi:O-antigen/teichoic acid export membrane protein